MDSRSAPQQRSKRHTSTHHDTTRHDVGNDLAASLMCSVRVPFSHCACVCVSLCVCVCVCVFCCASHALCCTCSSKISHDHMCYEISHDITCYAYISQRSSSDTPCRCCTGPIATKLLARMHAHEHEYEHGRARCSCICMCQRVPVHMVLPLQSTHIKNSNSNSNSRNTAHVCMHLPMCASMVQNRECHGAARLSTPMCCLPSPALLRCACHRSLLALASASVALYSHAVPLLCVLLHLSCVVSHDTHPVPMPSSRDADMSRATHTSSHCRRRPPRDRLTHTETRTTR